MPPLWYRPFAAACAGVPNSHAHWGGGSEDVTGQEREVTIKREVQNQGRPQYPGDKPDLPPLSVPIGGACIAPARMDSAGGRTKAPASDHSPGTV